MDYIDWFVLASTLAFIVIYGMYVTRKSRSSESYMRDGEAKWWTVGLSVMATQASAITFLSTPGQAYTEGMGFVQFYFGLPIAIIIICITFIPIYHKLKVYTAYEFLEKRFDVKTRTLTAGLFLIQRGLAAGITIYAPAIILSAVLGWELRWLVVIIGFLVIIYTVSGGTKAVNVTQKQQMIIIMSGMIIAFCLIVSYLPEDISFDNALSIAGAGGKMEVLDFSFDLDNNFTIWSGILGGTFLMLSYFGTDQSQVQRYLSGKSVRQMRIGLIFNGILKVPMQFFILLVGVMVFVFYQFNNTPLNFNPAAEKAVLASELSPEYAALQQEHYVINEDKKNLQTQYGKLINAHGDNAEIKRLEERIAALQLQESNLREEAKVMILEADADAETNDKDFVFIHFILNHLPHGLIGLLLAVILSAAMSSTASELNALASTTSIDIYRRFKDPTMNDDQLVSTSKWFTLMWGIIAIAFASVASLFENLIVFVNIIGSLFYGTILGIFLAAFYFKKIKAKAIFISAIISEIIVVAFWAIDKADNGIELLPFLWLNPLGAILTLVIAYLIQSGYGNSQKASIQA